MASDSRRAVGAVNGTEGKKMKGDNLSKQFSYSTGIGQHVGF